MDEIRDIEETERVPLYTTRDKMVIVALIVLFAVGCLISSVDDMMSLLAFWL